MALIHGSAKAFHKVQLKAKQRRNNFAGFTMG
jgi:hypothetical protein